MKKFVVLLVVVAISCFSAAAFAADISVSGSIDVRSRDFSNLNAVPKDNSATEDNATADGTVRDTQERVRLNVDAKAGDVKGRVSIENDWDDWGRLEAPQGNDATKPAWNGATAANGHLDLREAWINFNLPGVPLNVNVGHQLLQLGNGWFLRNMKYGDDAWVVANVTGANTAAFVDIKAAEGSTSQADDIDAYALLDVYKLSDDLTVGVDLANAKDRKNTLGLGGDSQAVNLYNLGVNLNGKFGPLVLKAEADLQAGKAKDANLVATPPSGDAKFKGTELVVQGSLPMDPVTINFTAARGSGDKPGDADYKGFKNFLDADPHYTFLYEYKVKTAAGAANLNGDIHTGFENTTALSVGATFAATKSLSVGADLWLLRATEAVAINGATDLAGNPATSRKLGTEVDVKINWQMYDNLSWNWQLGYFKPGDAYDSPALGMPAGVNATSEKVLGAQGILSFKF